MQGLASRPDPGRRGGAGLARHRVRRAAGTRRRRGRGRARRDRRAGAGQRRGPQHPRLAGRPSPLGERPRRVRARGCGSGCCSCRGSRSWSCSSCVRRRPTATEKGGGDEAPVRGRRGPGDRAACGRRAGAAAPAPRPWPSRTVRAPVETPLTTASVVCPNALPGTGSDLLGVTILGADPDAKVKGDLQVGLGASAAPLPVRTRRVSTAPQGLGPAVVTGSGDLAPGLVAGRSQSAPLAAVDCAPPVADQWFTGVGADATHNSVIELVNPNAGPAIADITVRSPNGVLDVPGAARRLGAGQQQHPARPRPDRAEPRRAVARGAHQPGPARGARRRLLRPARIRCERPGLAAVAGRAGHRQPAARADQGRRRAHARARPTRAPTRCGPRSRW